MFGWISSINFSFGQSNEEKYSYFIKKADSLYKVKDYKSSAFAYSSAFKAYGWKGTGNDRYNAACSWALAGVPDSAFFNLMKLAAVLKFSSYSRVTSDKDFESLYENKRWKEILELIKQNKDKAEASLNKPLVYELDTILIEDQKYRMQIEEVQKKYGWDSKEIKELWKIANEKDSINLIKVKAILNKYGWLGPDVIGNEGNSTLFLVIQHSNLKTQEKYLPMMREAVKNGKAMGSSLALLEDRVAIGEGKKQIYGSQIGMDQKTHTYFVLPLEDPDNVDKRRAVVGLHPLAEYVSHWQIKWDVVQYKKDLQKKEEKTRR